MVKTPHVPSAVNSTISSSCCPSLLRLGWHCLSCRLALPESPFLSGTRRPAHLAKPLQPSQQAWCQSVRKRRMRHLCPLATTSSRSSRQHHTLGLLTAGVTAVDLGDRVRSQGGCGGCTSGGREDSKWSGQREPQKWWRQRQRSGRCGWQCRPARREGDGSGHGGGWYSRSRTSDRLVAEVVTEAVAGRKPH